MEPRNNQVWARFVTEVCDWLFNCSFTSIRSFLRFEHKDETCHCQWQTCLREECWFVLDSLDARGPKMSIVFKSYGHWCNCLVQKHQGDLKSYSKSCSITKCWLSCLQENIEAPLSSNKTVLSTTSRHSTILVMKHMIIKALHAVTSWHLDSRCTLSPFYNRRCCEWIYLICSEEHQVQPCIMLPSFGRLWHRVIFFHSLVAILIERPFTS